MMPGNFLMAGLLGGTALMAQVAFILSTFRNPFTMELFAHHTKFGFLMNIVVSMVVKELIAMLLVGVAMITYGVLPWLYIDLFDFVLLPMLLVDWNARILSLMWYSAAPQPDYQDALQMHVNLADPGHTANPDHNSTPDSNHISRCNPNNEC